MFVEHVRPLGEVLRSEPFPLRIDIAYAGSCTGGKRADMDLYASVVSAGSRNFPGRSGPGRVILASPLVVAASALKGCVAAPDEVLA
jgi:3-isopropylmalate/(R)-2-methylmalate dehydratase large subunit